MNNLLELTKEEAKQVSGGYFVTVIGTMAALAYLYDWSYNYAHRKLIFNETSN